MKSKPLVSVCLITYNHADYIRQCLDSVLNQVTNFDFEICIGENSSDDNTYAICKEFADAYPDIVRLYRRSREEVHYVSGVPTGNGNLFETFKACKGQYIAVLDGDDYWNSKSKLQEAVDVLSSDQSVSLVFTGVIKVDSKGETIGSIQPDLSKGDLFDVGFLISSNNATASTVVARRFDLDEMGDVYWTTNMGDWPINVFLANKGKIKALPEQSSSYRIHSEGVWSKLDAEIRAYYKLRSLVAMLNAGWYDSCKNRAYKQYIKSAGVMLRSQSLEVNLKLKLNDEIIRVSKKLGLTKQKIISFYIRKITYKCALFIEGNRPDSSWFVINDCILTRAGK